MLDYARFLVKPIREVPVWQDARPRYDFGSANPGIDLIPVADLAEAARQAVLEEGLDLSHYPPAYGPRGIRETAQGMLRDRGIQVPLEAVLVTNGSIQAIALAVEIMIRPGDIIITEQFFYHGSLRRFRQFGAEVIGLETDADGMKIDVLEDTLAELRRHGRQPKLIYTIPNFQNPEGTILPLARKQKMLQLAQEYDCLIMEDECYVYQQLDVDSVPPPVASLEGGRDRVIYVATFSKLVGPGVRIGLATAPPPVLEQMTAYKQDLGNNMLSAMVVAHYIQKHMEARLPWANKLLKQKRDVLRRALIEHFGSHIEVNQPKGGMFLWVRFQNGVDMHALETKAKAAGIGYTAGTSFSPRGQGHQYARFNFATPVLKEIPDGIAALADLLRREGMSGGK